MTDHLVPLSTAVAPDRDRHRDLLDAAAAWQLDRPRRTHPDLFALVCAAAASSFREDVAPTRWTRAGMAHFLGCDLTNWCSRRRVLRPDGEVAALWEWVDFLHSTGRMHPASDPVAELRKPLACAGWLDQDGRPLPDDAPRQVECECFLPYREGAQLLGVLAQQAADRGEDVLDPLRRAAGAATARSPWDDRPWDGVDPDPFYPDPFDPDPFAPGPFDPDPYVPPRWSGSGP